MIKVTKMKKYIKLVCIIIFAVILLLVLCKLISRMKNADTVEFISEKQVAGIIHEITGGNQQQKNADSNEETGSEIEHPGDVENESESEEELRKRVCESIKAIDFSAGVHPINTEVYDSEMDREYKEAFLQMLFNQIPIQYEEQGEIYYRKSDKCFDDLDDEEYVRAIKNPNFRYHYMDFDGDGLPELVVRPESWDVHFGGPHIFKYNPEDKKIYNFGDEHRWSAWELLGSGKLYYTDSTVATLWYGYQEIDASGEQTIEIVFTVVSGHDYDEYEVSVDYSQDVTLSEDEWNEITQEYFEAIDNAPAGMTFEELFGDVEYPYNRKDIVLEDEVYLQEKELNMETRIGGSVEVRYPQIKKAFFTDAMSEQINLLIRDTAFSFFNDLEEITYEEVISRIEEEMKTGICSAVITYEVLQCTDEYLSIIFSVKSSNGFRVYISQYLATIDMDTGQYIHFSDIMDMEELIQVLESDYYEVYTGTHAFLKEEDVHEPDMLDECINDFENNINGLDLYQGMIIENPDVNSHYDRFSSQNIGVDNEYLYISMSNSEALNGYFIFRIPREYVPKFPIR